MKRGYSKEDGNSKRLKRHCCVPSCLSNNLTQTLFTFPVWSERCLNWLTNIKSKELEEVPAEYLKSHYFVCALHFENDQFAGPKKCKLKNNAVPTLMHGNSETLDEEVHHEIPSCSSSLSNNEINAESEVPLRPASGDGERDGHGGQEAAAGIETTMEDLDVQLDAVEEHSPISKKLRLSSCKSSLSNNEVTEVPLRPASGDGERDGHGRQEAAAGMEITMEDLDVQLDAVETSSAIPKKLRLCSVSKCENTSQNFCMHRFPQVIVNKDGNKTIDDYKLERLIAWIRASGNASLLSKDPMMLNKSFYVCGCHFHTNDYLNQIKKLLKHNAVPSLLNCDKLAESSLLEYKEKVTSWIDGNLNAFKLSDDECTLNFESDMQSLSWHTCDQCKETVMKSNRSNLKCTHQLKCWEYSSLNDMDPLDCPEELKCLTFIEEQLIALVHPMISVFKLKGLQFGYRGNVINFSQDVYKFASELPHKLCDLSCVFTVRYKNDKVEYRDFQVRGNKVLTALTWLKANNPFYKDIIVSEKSLELLPTDENVYEALNFVENVVEDDDEETGDGNDIDDPTSMFSEEHSSTVPIAELHHSDSQIRNVLEWPSMDDRPIDEFTTEGYIACAFPTLFPHGKADLRSSRLKTVNVSNYFRHLLNYHDERFAKHKTFRYFALNSWMRWSAINDGNIFVRNNPEYANMTIETLKEKIKENPSAIKKAMFQAANIRGTKQYWHTRCNELKDMVEQLGMPTFFLTLSAADGHWNDLYRLLTHGKDPNSLTENERRKLVQENPLIVDNFFSYRVDSFIEHVLTKKYNIRDYWYRIEFQHRGSPHLHGIFYVEDAPDITNYDASTDEEKKRILEYFDELCTAINPKPDCSKADVHPCRKSFGEVIDKENDLAQLLMTVQRHTKCSINYCLRINKRTKVRECRFKYPFELQENASIEYSERYGWEYFAARNDAWLNKFNRPIIVAWRANMDIAPVISKAALINYLSKYIAKSESTSDGFFHLVNLFLTVMEKSKTPKQALQKLFISTCAERDYSAQEVCHILSGNKLYSSSGRKFVIVNTSVKNEWIQLNNSIDENKQIGKTFMEKYKTRPADLHNLSMWNLAQDYNYVSSKWVKAKKANIVRVFPRYHKKGENDELYYEQQIILHVPWINLNEFPIDTYTWEHMYKNIYNVQATTIINMEKDPSIDTDDFEDNGEDNNTNETNLEEWMLVASFGPNQQLQHVELGRRECDIDHDWDAAYKKYEPYGCMNELHGFIQKHKSEDKQEERSYLAPTTVTYSDEQTAIINFMNDQILATKNNCVNSSYPLRILVQGKAGTGKSLIIKYLTSTLVNEFGPSSFLLLAPTGVAALNINGQTIHSVFFIPRSTKEFKPLTGALARKFCDMMDKIQYIIIDEYSMIGCNLLGMLNERCKQGKNSTNYFGGLRVWMFGDCKQLPAVLDTAIYYPADLISKEKKLALSGKAAFVNFQKVFFLTKCFRQSDVEFQSVLDGISMGNLDDKGYEMLSQRFTTNVSKEEQKKFEDAIRLFPTRKEVQSFNLHKLENLKKENSNARNPVARIPAKHNCKTASNATSEEADGLDPVIYLAQDCKIMLRNNLWTDKGLVNGAVGHVVDILYDKGSSPPEKPPSVIICKFECYKGPALIPGTKLVPIPPIQKSWLSSCQEMCTRMQFPLQLAYACSVHKSQGLSLEMAFISIGNVEFALGLSYTALTRIRTLAGLLLQPFNKDRITRLKGSKLMMMQQNLLNKLALLS